MFVLSAVQNATGNGQEAPILEGYSTWLFPHCSFKMCFILVIYKVEYRSELLERMSSEWKGSLLGVLWDFHAWGQ